MLIILEGKMMARTMLFFHCDPAQSSLHLQTGENVTKVLAGGVVSHLVQKLGGEKRFTVLIGSRDTASAHAGRPPNPLSSIMKELQMGIGK